MYPRTRLLLLLVIVAAGGCSSNPAAPDSAGPCVPGRQIACACGSGASGYQICNAAGTGYGSCLACGHDASLDHPRQDASLERAAETTGGCVFPTDKNASGYPPPTPGFCQGTTAAVTCDPQSHAMVARTCGPTEECLTYDVEDHPALAPSLSGRTYTWAGCVPKGAKACSWEWQAATGDWRQKTVDQCEAGNKAALWCTRMPLPSDLQAFGSGSKTGFTTRTPCDSDEVCAVSDDLAACFLSPLQPCPAAVASCASGTVAHVCDGGGYLRKRDCTVYGALSGDTACRVQCVGSTSFAGCFPPPSAGDVCDPSTTADTCASALNIKRCELCFQESGTCVCRTKDWSCNDRGCFGASGWASSCKCATLVRPDQTTFDSCVDAAATLCDPKSTAGTCVGDTARVCTGMLTDFDCAKKYGQTCKVVGSIAGCTDAPLVACTSSTTATCDSGKPPKLVACCPPSGYYTLASGVGLPCAPGFQVRFDCSAVSYGTSCKQLGSATCL